MMMKVMVRLREWTAWAAITLSFWDLGSVDWLRDLDISEFIGNCFDHTILVTQTDK